MNITQLCPTLCNPMDYTVHEILQARILEWVDFLSPGDLPNPDIEPRSPTLQADSLPAELPGRPIYGKSQSLKGCVNLFYLFFSQVGRVRLPLYEPSKDILVYIQTEGQCPLRQVLCMMMIISAGASKLMKPQLVLLCNSCGAQVPSCSLWASLHCGMWHPRDQTHGPCILREILNHCTIREAPGVYFLRSDLLYTVLLVRDHVQRR